MESLIEQRVHSDPGADPRLIRISVGVEDLEVKCFPVDPRGQLWTTALVTGSQGRSTAGIPDDCAGPEGQTVNIEVVG